MKTQPYRIDYQTWTHPTTNISQVVEVQSVGRPVDPGEVGRLAVKEHAEDLRKLAE